MAVLNVMLGSKLVALDTDKPAESQVALGAAVNEAITAAKTESATAKATELNASIEAGTKSREYIADAIVARYKAADDTVLSERVKDDTAANAYRSHLLSLPVQNLLDEHKLSMNVKVKKAQTESAEPKTPETPTDKTELQTLSEEYAPKQQVIYVTA